MAEFLNAQQRARNARFRAYCGPIQSILATAAMAEQPAYGIRQVTERTSRSNGGCVEVETGRSWPAALIQHLATKQALEETAKMMNVGLQEHV